MNENTAPPRLKSYSLPNWLISHFLFWAGTAFDLAPIAEGRKRFKFTDPAFYDLGAQFFYVISIEKFTPEQVETLRAMIQENAPIYAAHTGGATK